MFSSEKEIIDYHENLIFKIDTIHESRKLHYKKFLDKDNKDRITMISKIKEIEIFNLDQYRSNSNDYKFCFVIQNKLVKCSISGKIRKTALSLMITNFFLDDDLIQKIR